MRRINEFAPNHHIFQRRYDRRRNLAVGFRKSLDQMLQVWGEFGSGPPKDFTKPVRDFIANRAGVRVINLDIYAASFRHSNNSAKSDLINMSQ
jgi:hypothetical protein